MKSLLFLCLLTLSAWGDEAAPPPLWEKNAEGSLLFTAGNTQVTNIGLGLGLVYRPLPWTFKFKGGYLTSSDTGILKANSLNTELRGERKLSDPLSVFLQTTYLRNTFAGFNSRVAADAGVNYLLSKTENQRVSSEVGFGYVSENRTDPSLKSFTSGRLAAEYQRKLSATSDLSVKLTFLENLASLDDWRLSGVASLTAVVTSIFSLKASLGADYLNVPVTGKKKTDVSSTIALVAKF